MDGGSSLLRESRKEGGLGSHRPEKLRWRPDGENVFWIRSICQCFSQKMAAVISLRHPHRCARTLPPSPSPRPPFPPPSSCAAAPFCLTYARVR